LTDPYENKSAKLLAFDKQFFHKIFVNETLLFKSRGDPFSRKSRRKWKRTSSQTFSLRANGARAIVTEN